MQAVAPRVVDWIKRMREPAEAAAAPLLEDACPATLEPVLARMFRELGPVLESTLARLADAQLQADGYLPRSLGRHVFTLEQARAERNVYPFNAYRFQRAQTHYQQLDSATRSRADALLERVGGRALVSTAIARPLTRVNNRLTFA